MECDGCGMCCYIAPTPWLNKEHSTLCEHYIEGHGCGIWMDIPWQCKDYTCWYRESDNLPEDINPKNCKVLIEKHDDIFIITTDPDNFDSWKNVIKFIDQVCEKGYSIVITSYTDKRRLVITEQGKSEVIWQKIRNLIKEEYGST